MAAVAAAGMGLVIELGKGTVGRCGACRGCQRDACGVCSLCKRGALEVGSILPSEAIGFEVT